MLGYFALKVDCDVCNKKVGLNRHKVFKSNVWICPKCLKKAGGFARIDTFKMTIEEIKSIISGDNLLKYNDMKLTDAANMYQYCLDNNFGTGLNKKWGLKHFKVLEDHLMDDENILMNFIGMHNYGSDNYYGYCAYAITDKRIMIGQKKTLSGHNFISVSHKKINDISLNTGMTMGVLTIDTPQERIRVGLNKDSAASVNSKIYQVLSGLKAPNIYKQQSPPSHSSNVAEEIKQYKELLDMGAITDEEFAAKKKQLLEI